MHKTYRSDISHPLALLLAVILGGATLMQFLRGFTPTLPITLLVDAVVLHVYWCTYYTINDQTLLIRSGMFVRTRIDIHSITRIQPTDSILSAPALSFDRIEISYHTYDQVVISPKDKEAFIQDLLRINDRIVVHST